MVGEQIKLVSYRGLELSNVHYIRGHGVFSCLA